MSSNPSDYRTFPVLGCSRPVIFGAAESEPGQPCARSPLNYAWEDVMIRKLASGEYRLYSRKINPKTGKRRNLGTFRSRAAAEKHERDVQYFKRH